MEIGPVKNGGLLPREPEAQRSQKEVVESDQDRGDTVRISDEARSKLEPGTGALESTDDRFQRIRERIDSGYYDRDQVKQETIERLIDTMLENINEFYK